MRILYRLSHLQYRSAQRHLPITNERPTHHS
jgi:hypothetical protein